MKTSPWALLVPNSHQERAACGASRTQKGPGRSILTPPKGAFGAEVLHLRGRGGCNEAICASPSS